METKFNSQICTTKEQSERLLALGLKKETADMRYDCIGRMSDTEMIYREKPIIGPVISYYDIPAWSLHRLWELYWSNKVGSDCLFGCGKHMSPYAKMVAMIEYDIEDGTFNKDYLEK